MLTHNDSIRHSGFEGYTVETAKGLLVLVTCMRTSILLHSSKAYDPRADIPTIVDLDESFFFGAIRKCTLQTRLCSDLCDKVRDKNTSLICGGVILPMGGMALFLTFAPTADNTFRTSLPKEIWLPLRRHKALFYQGGPSHEPSSIPAPPAYIFHIALLTLPCLEQTNHHVPSPTEGPRQVFDVVANVTPHGHAP